MISYMDVLNMTWGICKNLNFFDFAWKLMVIPFVSSITLYTTILNSWVAIFINCRNRLIIFFNSALLRILTVNLTRILLIFLLLRAFLLQWGWLICNKKWFGLVLLLIYRQTTKIILISFHFWSFPKKINFFSQIIYFLIFLNYLNLQVLNYLFLPQFLSIQRPNFWLILF